ncbi:MAG TPA: PaaI family thioesterase [Casimicrobiaceae bacterium]|nr:PaaI family thioesterase [Casimicrobiaceae bacterium]
MLSTSMPPRGQDSEATDFAPVDPDYEERVRASFARQGAMRLLGARLLALSPGFCAIELPCREDLTQQHGYIHAGIVSAIADSAGGYAGFTLFPGDASVLTVEYKLNLLAPAAGERLVAEGRVVKPGRTLAVTRGEVYAEAGGRRTLCALMQQTLIVLAGKPDA